MKVVKTIDQEAIWRKVKEMVSSGAIPYVIEAPLSFIEQALWPLADSNELKFKGKILGHVLRLHGVTISKRNGVRYAVFPKSILSAKQGIKEKKGKKKEPERVLVESVWAW
jgi:hypothetical protein